MIIKSPILPTDTADSLIAAQPGIRTGVFERHVELSPLTQTNQLSSPSKLVNSTASATPPPLIGYSDWKVLKNLSYSIKHPIMLVVAQEDEGTSAAALSSGALHEVPLQTSISVTNESENKMNASNNNSSRNAKSVLTKNLTLPMILKSTASGAGQINRDVASQFQAVTRAAATLSSNSNSTMKEVASKLTSSKASTAQQAFNDFVQKVAPLILPAVASILKSTDAQSQLQKSIDENANYIGSPQRIAFVRMKPERGVGINRVDTSSTTARTWIRALKIEKMQKNEYGISRKMHSNIDIKPGSSEENKLEHRRGAESAEQHLQVNERAEIRGVFAHKVSGGDSSGHHDNDNVDGNDDDGDTKMADASALVNAQDLKLKSIYSKLFG
ncbi:unnamed protein product [Gongylonema pulchrum]|uniref:Uncharacterized protein n=1 Tax=Gongylonema pulchrum TaxID=637853 RepID=A0A3P6RI22_9BILA|nr:unnamed protein product [Gongylonema pulchrum]